MSGRSEALRQALRAVKGIRAYHGSPHDFDRFDMSRIGAGEGAQAYGHGLYFAENEGVARAYRDSLAKVHGSGMTRSVTSYDVGGRHISEANPEWATADVAGMMQTHGIDPATKDGAEWLASEIAARRMGGADITKDRVLSFLRADVRQERVPGRMYEVNLRAAPDDFVDWDAPIAGQDDRVRGAWDDFLASPAGESADKSLHGALYGREGQFADPHGRDLYQTMAEGLIGVGAPRPFAQVRVEATNALRDAGIPGIRYLDQGSRGVGEGTRNYVVFDDSIVDILRKYAVPGAIGLGSGSALTLREALRERMSA